MKNIKDLFLNRKHYIIYIVLFVMLSIAMSVSSVISGDGGGWSNFFFVVTSMIVSAVLMFIFAYSVEEAFASHKDSTKNSILTIVVEVLCAAGMFFACRSSLGLMYLTPAIFVSALFSILYGYKIAVSISIVNVILTAYFTPPAYQGYIPVILLLCLIVSRLIILTKERSTLTMIGLGGAAIAFLVSFGVFLVLDGSSFTNWQACIMNALFLAINCFISAMLIVGILPLFERLSGVLTEFRAQELMNQTTPLMKKLISEAPGTYHHSVMVSNLGEAAAEAIGANVSLVRVAAMYHDIGKLKRPHCFIENQSGVNPHDQLSPIESRDILFAHVTDGVELGKKYKLPDDVISIIGGHHGTSSVKYFYYKMLKDEYRSDSLTEDDFRYPGSKPVSKECVIVMLADCVEAAVRAMSDKSTEAISQRVDDVIYDKMQDNQLSEADISFRELNIIKDKFKSVVGGYYHQRTEYVKPK